MPFQIQETQVRVEKCAQRPKVRVENRPIIPKVRVKNVPHRPKVRVDFVFLLCKFIRQDYGEKHHHAT
jgi:hypothetical protein